MCRGFFAFEQLVWHTLVTVSDLFWCRWIHLVEIFPTILVKLLSELGVPSGSFFLFLFFFSFISPLYNLWRERIDKKVKKKISEAHQSFSDDITDIVEKILTRWIKWHQGRSPMVIEVCHISRLKANEPQHIWIALVAHSGHHLWLL
jgi:hypothetical protein